MKLQSILYKILFISILCVCSYAVVDCNPDALTKSWQSGEPTENLGILCENKENYSVTLTKTSPYFSLSSQNIGPAPSKKTIIINFSSDASAGNYFGEINFADNSTSIPVFMTVTKKEICADIDIFPTVLSNVKVLQGESKSRNIQLTVPNCFDSQIKVSGVALQSDEKPIKLGELSIGMINPGSSVMIPIDIDSSGVARGTYQDILLFNVFDDDGVKVEIPSVSISVTVTGDINPESSFDLSNLPVCTLSTSEMVTNKTETLTCTNVQPNIQVVPNVDTFYIQGIKVTETASNYAYEFKPILPGTTTIRADFKFKNAPVGSPYKQQVRISPMVGSVNVESRLKAEFYQGGIKVEGNSVSAGEVSLLIIDTATNTIVDDFDVRINGILTNATLNLDPEKVYDIRISSPGYKDRVLNISTTKNEVPYTLQPSKEEYSSGDILNVIARVNGVTKYFDGVIIEESVQLQSGGVHQILLKADGYSDTIKNITVDDSVKILNYTPPLSEWKKKIEAKVLLSKSVNWQVVWNEIGGTETEIVSSGVGKELFFDITKYGNYVFFDVADVNNPKIIGAQNVLKKDSTGFLSLPTWFWITIISLIVLFVIYNYFKNPKTTDEETPFTVNLGDDK